MDLQRRIFTNIELMQVKHGSLTYYMAGELKKLGAPIDFNTFNLELTPDDIEINGFLEDRIRPDCAHEFIFKPKENN